MKPKDILGRKAFWTAVPRKPAGDGGYPNKVVEHLALLSLKMKLNIIKYMFVCTDLEYNRHARGHKSTTA